MNKIKITSNIVFAKGIFMVLLGIFHICAITFIYDDNKFIQQMPGEIYKELALWFVVGGIFFIFSGIIDIISYRGLKGKVKMAWQFAFVSAVFSVAGSTLGIIVFREGPPFLIFAFGLVALVPLVLFRKEFKTS
jgi:hypothetical protein